MKLFVQCNFIRSNEIPPNWGYFWGYIAPPKHDTPSRTLSDARLRHLKPKTKTYKVLDFEGLFVAVTPNGSKLWRFKYRVDGKEKLLVIGAYPAVSLLQARQARDAARADIAAGEDPSERKQEAKRIRRESQGHTFAKVGAVFLDKQRKEGKSAATLSKSEYHLKLANKDFGKKPISEVTSPMVLRCLRKVEAKGNYETAHRLRSRIGSIFRYAVASGIAEHDPTSHLSQNRPCPVIANPSPKRPDPCCQINMVAGR